MSAHLTPSDFHQLLAGDSDDIRIQHHLDTCLLCARQLQYQRQTDELLGQIKPQKAPERVRQLVIDNLQGRSRSNAFRWVASFASAAIILIGSLFLILADKQASQAPETGTSGEGFINLHHIFSAIAHYFHQTIDLSGKGLQFFSDKIVTATDQAMLVGGILLLVILFYLIDTTIHLFKQPFSMNRN